MKLNIARIMLVRTITIILCLWCFGLIGMVFGQDTHSGIKIDGNGYTGVSIVISNYVEEDITLIGDIKDAFTEASQLLYEATEYRLYFKEIKIYVPKDWYNTNYFGKVLGTRFDSFPIRIARSRYASAAFVEGLAYCGGRGRFMQIMPEVLSNEYQDIYGDRKMVIVHEWAHLRYGVFDEYPKFSIDENFYNEEGTWKPVRCTEEIKGTNLKNCSDNSSKCRLQPNGKPESDCQFCPFQSNHSNTTKASLMGFNWLNYVELFCKKNESGTQPNRIHNSNAINRHNKECRGKSVWEILNENPDIEAISPGSPDQNTKPRFRVMQDSSELVVVFVLDVSGSMKGDRLQKLQMTAKDYILDGALNGTWIGIVEFDNTARILQKITKITSKSVRKELTSALPKTTRGWTSIGAGLLKGYQMIWDHGSVVAGARIMLVTDGDENEEPTIKDVLPKLISDEIVIDGVMVTDEADPNIEKMSSDTGGKSYFYTGFYNPTVMDTAFDSLVPDDELSVQIHTSAISIRKGEMENVSFYIDKSINRDLKIRLSLSGKNASVNILIRMPSGKTKQFQYRFSDMHTACIPLKGNNEPGEYLIKLSTNSSQNCSGEILITSKNREESFTSRRKREASMRESFDVVGWLSENTFNISEMQKISVHASVSMAYAPIIYGNVSAWIEDGRGNMFHLQMKDDGIGSDSEAKDGVYSASILAPRIMANGRHSVKIKASNLKAEAKLLVRDRGRSTVYRTYLKEVDVEKFQREKVIQGFTVSGYSSHLSSGERWPTDTLPPSRITSLSIQSYSATNKTFMIEWMAPGDDYEFGQASRYDVRITDSPETLRSNTDNATQIVMTRNPKPAGEIEIMVIKPEVQDMTYYIGIRGVDDMDNYGEMSNILSVSVITDPIWASNTDNEADDADNGAGDADNGAKRPCTGIVIGILAFMVLSYT